MTSKQMSWPGFSKYYSQLARTAGVAVTKKDISHAWKDHKERGVLPFFVNIETDASSEEMVTWKKPATKVEKPIEEVVKKSPVAKKTMKKPPATKKASKKASTTVKPKPKTAAIEGSAVYILYINDSAKPVEEAVEIYGPNTKRSNAEKGLKMFYNEQLERSRERRISVEEYMGKNDDDGELEAKLTYSDRVIYYKIVWSTVQ